MCGKMSLKDHYEGIVMSELSEICASCVRALSERGLTISFAESCTGGLCAKTLTDVSGASSVFECGIVSYSGRIKHEILGVPRDVLDTYGEVSQQTAEAMATGVARISGADIGIGITGIAGPTGATATKKVGLIYLSVFYKGEIHSQKLELYDVSYSRERRRIHTATRAFQTVMNLL